MRHPVVRAKVGHFLDKQLPVRGIVHVGANDGEEIPYYVSQGLTPILAFEPHPYAFAELEAAYGEFAECHQVALGAMNGSAVLHVPLWEGEPSSKGSSLLPMATGLSALPEAARFEVRVERFDQWMFGCDLTPYNILVVDVQGMELDVLKGFGDCLDGFDYLCVECSAVPMYEGEASAQEVVDWLAERGFRQDSPIEPHNDLFFLRP